MEFKKKNPEGFAITFIQFNQVQVFIFLLEEDIQKFIYEEYRLFSTQNRKFCKDNRILVHCFIVSIRTF